MEIKVDIPVCVIIPTSVLGAERQIGLVRAAWRGTIQVEFTHKDGRSHLGQYTVLKHTIIEASLKDWFAWIDSLEINLTR